MSLSQVTIPLGTKGGSTPESYVSKYNNNISALLAWAATVPTNFVFTTLQNNDVLIYDSGSGNWVNSTKTAADLASKATADAHYAKQVDDTDTDTTKDKHISNALAKGYTDHLAASSSIHGVSGSVVGTTDIQTLTNKTLTSPVIATISNTGTITLPTSTDTLVGRDTTDTLTNKSLVDNTTYVIDNSDNTKKIQFQLSGITTGTTRTVTLPDRSFTLDELDGNTLFEQTTTPSIPSAGYNKLYFKSDNNLYYLNSSGTELQLGTTTLTSIDCGDVSGTGTTLQIRRDTAADWSSGNPTLASAEIGFETDTNLIKFGNGTTAWNSLPYFSAGSVPAGEINTMSSVGSYNSIYYQKSGVDLQVKSIQAGANIVITDNTTYLTISATSTLSNIDNVFKILNVSDNTKIIDFDASGITTGNTRTITMSDFDVTLGVSNGNNTFTQITTPSTPSAGSNKLYFKADNKVYKLNSSGVEEEVGSSGRTVVTKTGTYTANIGEDVLCSGTFTVDLPTASGVSGQDIVIKNNGTGTITVDGNSSETIDGELTIDISVQYDSVTLRSDGTNWYIV